MSGSADPGPSSASAITDPTAPATSVMVAPNGMLLLDVADTRPTTRAPGIPKDIRQLVRDEGLTRPTPMRATLHSLAIVCLWGGLSAIGLLANRWVVWVPVWLTQVIVLHGIHSAMHDAAHGSLYRSRTANRIAGLLWSVPLVMNASLWRAWHLEHHRATATDDDPQFLRAPSNIAGYLLAFPLTGMRKLGSFVVHSVGVLVGRPPAYARRSGVVASMRIDSLFVVALLGGIAAAATSAPGLVLTLWAVPFLGYWLVGSVFFGLAEHHATSTSGGLVDVSRTIDSWAPTRFVTWNSNYHAAHHLVPSVTYRNLPRLDEALGDRTVHRARSFSRFHLRVAAGLLRGGGGPGSAGETPVERQVEPVGAAPA